jgi:hypothetical protein
MKSTLRNAAVVALVALGTVVAVGTPAQADTVAGSCYDNVYGVNRLDASAIYWVDGTGEFWVFMEGSIHGRPFTTGGNLGNQNNVNLRLVQDGGQIWAKNSPDNIPDGGGFSGNPNKHTPSWSVAQARVEGVFDRRHEDDPRCEWWSPGI